MGSISLIFGMFSPRYRCGSGKSCSQLTVEELSSFVRQLYNLSCSLPEAPKLKVGQISYNPGILNCKN